MSGAGPVTGGAAGPEASALRAELEGDEAVSAKLVSVMLRYPDENILGARGEFADALEELPDIPRTRSIARFFEHWSRSCARELREEYVRTFDIHSRRANLNLTYAAYGDTRERGRALLGLKELYRAAGFPFAGRELPDYLPAMLEFAALAPAGYGRELLLRYRAEIELARLALREMESPYAHLLDAVVFDLGDMEESDRGRLMKLAREGPPSEGVGVEPLTQCQPTHGGPRGAVGDDPSGRVGALGKGGMCA